MKTNLYSQLEEVVNKNIRTLHPKDSIERAMDLFEQTNRKILPVVSNQEIKGILFMQNFKAVDKANKFFVKLDRQIYDISPMRVEDFMTTDFKVLSVRSKLIDALNFFLEYRQYYIPVVDMKQFVGLITPFDVFQYFKELHEFDKDL